MKDKIKKMRVNGNDWYVVEFPIYGSLRKATFPTKKDAMAFLRDLKKAKAMKGVD